MTFEDSSGTTFQVASAKGVKKKAEPVAQPEQQVQPTVAPKQRRRRAANTDPYADLKQIITIFRGLSKARRKIALSLLATLFE